jgi:hypothetical protein
MSDWPDPALSEWPRDRTLRIIRVFSAPDHRGWRFYDVLDWSGGRRRHTCGFGVPPESATKEVR